MTDNEIIKALECCAYWESDKNCDECPANTFGFGCAHKMAKNSLDLIDRQKTEIAKLEKVEKYADETIKAQVAEIERLKSDNDILSKNLHNLSKELEAEKIRNF